MVLGQTSVKFRDLSTSQIYRLFTEQFFEEEAVVSGFEDVAAVGVAEHNCPFAEAEFFILTTLARS